MKTAHVKALPLTVNRTSGQGMIYPTLIWDDEAAVLIDTGFPGMLPTLREAVGNAGVPFERIHTVILTHQDIDHIGSLPDVRAALEAEIVAHAVEKPYIQGDRPLVKADPAQMQKMLQRMPEAVRGLFMAVLAHPPKAPVDRTVVDGEELPVCGGITVIHTPGHTPGHISLYHRPSKTLISGDALVIEDGRLCGPRPSVAADIGTARKSLEKFRNFDIATVICYHGGVSDDHVNERIAALAKEA